MSAHNHNRRGRYVTTMLGLLLICASIVHPDVLNAAPVQQPQVGARAAILVEYPSGRVLYEKCIHIRMAPASTTKILTAILALEYGKLSEVVTIAPRDMMWGTSMGLQSGEQQTLQNLLYGLLLPSGNDAAMAIARYIGTKGQAKLAPTLRMDPVSYFVRMMNARAAQMDLKDSHFVNPHGLDAPGHYTSAYDLASLTWYAMHYQAFNQIVKQRSYEVPGHSLLNLNKMLQLYAGAEGGKTGYTGAAGLCLVTTATRNSHRLISIVLNAPRWTDDSTALLDYGFAQLSGGSSGTIVRGVENLAIARLPNRASN